MAARRDACLYVDILSTKVRAIEQQNSCWLKFEDSRRIDLVIFMIR